LGKSISYEAPHYAALPYLQDRQRDHLRDLAVDETIIYNIEMGLKEMGCEGTQWVHLAQDMAQ
jgi:hypothetical protein